MDVTGRAGNLDDSGGSNSQVQVPEIADNLRLAELCGQLGRASQWLIMAVEV